MIAVSGLMAMPGPGDDCEVGGQPSASYSLTHGGGCYANE